jgi:phage gp29-like protein
MVAFVVDPFMNIVGIAGQQANSMGLGLPSPGAYIANPQYLLPREKFAVLTFRPENNDPRGTSLLRAAYDPWVRKRQVLPEYVKYLAQFATPGLIGTVGPDADDAPDPDKPEQTITPEEALARTLSSFANSVAIALPDGTQVKVVESQGEGAAILNALAHCDQQIVVGILAQTLATMEGEHQARAAAMVHLEVLDTVVRQAKKSVVRMIRSDILRQWVLYNWGPTYLPLVPRCTLTSTEQRQKPALMQAVSQLITAGFFQPDQYPALDEMLGSPPRDLAILQQTIVAQQAAALAAAAPAPAPTTEPPADAGNPTGAPADQPPAAAPAA